MVKLKELITQIERALLDASSTLALLQALRASPPFSQVHASGDESPSMLRIGGFSYALMLGFMVLSVIYDKEFATGCINFGFDTGRLITNWLELVGRSTYF